MKFMVSQSTSSDSLRQLELSSERTLEDVVTMSDRDIANLYAAISGPDANTALYDLCAMARERYVLNKQPVPLHVQAAYETTRINGGSGTTGFSEVIEQSPFATLTSVLACEDLRRFGATMAKVKSSGHMEDASAESKIVGYGLAAVKQIRAEPYNPERHYSDHIREECYLRARHERDEAHAATQQAADRLRDREELIAQLEDNKDSFHFPWSLGATVILVLSVAVSPTLHDVFFSSVVGPVGWLLAAAVGVLIAASISIGITSSVNNPHPGGLHNRIGLAGGVVCYFGISVLRVAGAGNITEYISAAGLFLIEIGTVLLLKWASSMNRLGYLHWFELRREQHRAQALLRAAERELGRRERKMVALQRRIEEHVAHLEGRFVRSQQLEVLQEAAIAAIQQGYVEGLLENRLRQERRVESTRQKTKRKSGSVMQS